MLRTRSNQAPKSALGSGLLGLAPPRQPRERDRSPDAGGRGQQQRGTDRDADEQRAVTLAITGMPLGGFNPGDFQVSHNCGGACQQGARCTISITVTGTRTARINVVGTVSNSPQNIALTGTGVAATPGIITTRPALGLEFTRATGRRRAMSAGLVPRGWLWTWLDTPRRIRWR